MIVGWENKEARRKGVIKNYLKRQTYTSKYTEESDGEEKKRHTEMCVY